MRPARQSSRSRRERKVIKMTMLQKFLKDEKGLELVEYAVMTALIVAVLVTAIGLLSTSIENRLGEVEGVIDNIAT